MISHKAHMIIINLFPISKGGGLQNAFSLLTALKNRGLKNYLCMVRKGSQLEKYCLRHDIKFKSFKDGILGRIFFELFFAHNSCIESHAKVVFTLFGNCPIRSGNAVKIAGFARSNIVEQDNEFWSFLPWHKKILKQLSDKIILLFMKASNVVILETDRLGKLSSKNKIFGEIDNRVVKMAASGLIVSELKELPKIVLADSDTINITYITGSHPNKNIPFLAAIFQQLNSLCGDKRFNLVCTLPDDTYLAEVRNEFNNLGILDNIKNLGFLSSHDIPKAIEHSHALINVAHLESFSNNWVEAWASKRLLICRDAQYAKDSCFNSAVYIDLEKPSESAKRLIEIFHSQSLYDEHVKQGQELLKNMPNSDEKFEQYLRIINEFL